MKGQYHLKLNTSAHVVGELDIVTLALPFTLSIYLTVIIAWEH